MFSRLATAVFLTLLTAFPANSDAASAIQLISSPALSPDGTQLAFAWRGDIWTVSITGGEAQPLTAHEASDGQPSYSPDGTQIAFISNRTGSNQVFVMPATGGEPKQLTFHSEGYAIEEWYPDGASILTSVPSRDHFAQERPFFHDQRQRAANW